jgi:hypothetical protein
MDIQIPKSIKIGGLNYSVTVVENLPTACADTNFQKQAIRIEEAHPKFMQQAFIHEILHTINGEWDELSVEFMAMAWFQIFQDNPSLFKKKVKKSKKKG